MLGPLNKRVLPVSLVSIVNYCYVAMTKNVKRPLDIFTNQKKTSVIHIHSKVTGYLAVLLFLSVWGLKMNTNISRRPIIPYIP